MNLQPFLFLSCLFSISVASSAGTQTSEVFRAPSPIRASTSDADYSYFASSSPPQIWRLDRSTGSTILLLSQSLYSDPITELVTDGRDLYYVSEPSRTGGDWWMNRVSIHGGAATRLASSNRSICRPRIKGQHLYWLTRSTWAKEGPEGLTLADGEVRRISLSGGAIELLNSSLLLPSNLNPPNDRLDLALDASHLFVISFAGVVRLPQSGGVAALISPMRGFHSFAKAPENRIWLVSSAAAQPLHRIQIWELVQPSLSLHRVVGLDVVHAPDSIDTELSLDGTKVFVATNTTGPRLCCVVGKVFVVSPDNPSYVSTLIESFYVVLLGADGARAYIAVTSPQTTGATSVVRIDYSGRSRNLQRR